MVVVVVVVKEVKEVEEGGGEMVGNGEGGECGGDNGVERDRKKKR